MMNASLLRRGAVLSRSLKRRINTAQASTAAAAALVCIYAAEHSYTQRTQAERSLLSNAQLHLVQDLAQEAKRSIQRAVTAVGGLPAARSGDFLSLHQLDDSLSDHSLPKLSAMQAKKLIQALHAGRVLDAVSLVTLAHAVTAVFQSEATVVDLRQLGNDITVVGDVHGSLPCLKRVMQLVGQLDQGGVMVVAGDYVDRGEHSLEVLCTFLILKLAYPKNVFLLRGNHEDHEICSEYGFLDELREKYGFETDEDGIWEALSDVFAALPLAAKTQTSVILHGGIPSADFQLSDLEAIDGPTRFALKTLTEAKTAQERLIEGVLWSDPVPYAGVAPNERGYGIEFGPDVAKAFLDRHGLRYLIRAHEHVEEGAQVMECGDGKGVVTVFSTANYPYGEGTNAGAVLKVHQQSSKFESIAFTYADDSPRLDAFRPVDARDQHHIRAGLLARIEAGNANLPVGERLRNPEQLLELLEQGEIDLESVARLFRQAAA